MEFLAALLLPIAFWVLKWLNLPFWIAGLPLILVILLKKNPYWGKLLAWPALVIGLISVVFQSEELLYFYPVIVNLTLLSIFGLSLMHSPTIIEKIARMTDARFTDHDIGYARKCTIAWCLFFIFNASIALTTAMMVDKTIWAIYNGGIAYALMGLMFLGEWLIRQRRIKHGP